MKRETWTILMAAAALVALAIVPATHGDQPEGEAGADGATVELYNKKCAMCHGKDGVAKPMAKGSGNFNDPEWQKVNPVEGVVKVMSEGKGKMPGYDGKLTPDEIRAVAEYVKTMK
jgi:cytochrome c6